MKYLLLNVLAVLLLAACNTNPNNPTADTMQEESPAMPAGQQFGDPVAGDDALAFSELLERMSENPGDTLQTRVHGTVASVCKMKGCWMNIAEEGQAEPSMMVRFKDYGFFVPMDIDGREVVMSGKAFYTTTSVEELKHYAEDAGKSAEEIAAITEPKRELSFLADGVLLLNEE